MYLPRSRPTPRRATGVVEFAFVAIVFFTFLFGIIEFGQLVMVNNLLDSAAREGARVGVVNTNQGTALTGMIQAEVMNRLGGMVNRLQNFNQATDIQVTVVDGDTGAQVLDSSGNPVPPEGAAFGQYIQVHIVGRYQPMLPSLLHLSAVINISGNSHMNCEAN
jgi:TadE-like protein